MKSATMHLVQTAPSAKAPEQLMEELLRENTSLRRRVSELEAFRKLAHRDALTGMWNRRYFEGRLNQELSRVRRDPTRCFSVLVVDVNDLKRINDERGHLAGDLAIKRAGSFLQSTLREYDVVCRLGGDEFAVILPDAGPAECEQLIARLRRELDAQNSHRDIAIKLSFGTASCPDEAADGENLYLQADAAMYKDKRRQKAQTA
jgi:two-component system, cell cycle response regulator